MSMILSIITLGTAGTVAVAGVVLVALSIKCMITGD